MEGFIEEAIAVDAQVAELIDQQKDDFYSKYRYLKPDCEKDFWEKAIDRAHSVGEWCREHWKAAVTIVLVGGSVSLTGDIGEMLIRGEDISLGQIIQHAVVSAAFPMAFAAGSAKHSGPCGRSLLERERGIHILV